MSRQNIYHPKLTKKTKHYCNNRCHYQNWVDLKQQAITHMDIKLRDRHLIHIREKINKIQCDQSKLFDYVFTGLLLVAMEVFYCSNNIALNYASISKYANLIQSKFTSCSEEKDIIIEMLEIVKLFVSQKNKYCSPKIFYGKNSVLCERFTENHKRYGYYVYQRWLSTN